MSADEPPPSRIYLTLYVFRGDVDTWFNRHVLAYWTSPEDPALTRTVHARRDADDGQEEQQEGDADDDDEERQEQELQPPAPWRVVTDKTSKSWALDKKYLSHVNGGIVQVPRGQEARPAEIMASVSVADREQQTDWNGQHFVLEGLQKIVDQGLQSGEWYDWVEGQLMDKLMDGAVP
jgi:hypothetical protein